MKQLVGQILCRRTSFVLALTLLLAACGGQTQTKDFDAETAGESDLKVGVKPEPDSEVAVIEMADSAAYGPIVIELYPNIAPQMVERFKTLAREGFYNGASFHRVMTATEDSPGGVIQGGDPLSKDDNRDDDGQGNSDYPDLPAELSDIPFEQGTLGAARGSDLDSANCQFFISTGRNAQWDRQYTVFGKVIRGINNAKIIASAPGDKRPDASTNPNPKVVIKSITLQPRSSYAGS